MSTRGRVSLTARERAAIAHLEALVQAEDPEFARKMEGGRLNAAKLRFAARLQPEDVTTGPVTTGPVTTGLGRFLGSRWWAALLIISGLVLMLFALGESVAAGVAGALVAATGIALMASRVVELHSRRRERPGQA